MFSISFVFLFFLLNTLVSEELVQWTWVSLAKAKGILHRESGILHKGSEYYESVAQSD